MTPADSRRIRLVSDAVVSAYIRDISTHTGSGDAPEPAGTHGARADRLSLPRRAPRRRQDLAHGRRTHQGARGLNAV